MEAAMYQYTESGLDNIYLENGYHIHPTPYGKGVSIQDTEGLHKAIGRWLISLPKPLNGAELRFIRLEMEATQRDLGEILGTTEQTLRLWEKKRNKAMPRTADRLLRALYSEYLGANSSVRRMLKRLAEFNQIEHVQACFQETNTGWKACEDPPREARA
jgi:DNA-binding transcriptional regulator YiaG